MVPCIYAKKPSYFNAVYTSSADLLISQGYIQPFDKEVLDKHFQE